MESTTPDVTTRLAARLRILRTERGLTLDGLAERAGVSRAAISLIERGESSPTASVLGRLAAGLGVSLASLFAEEERAGARPVARHADQAVWRDPETGYERRNLSPPGFHSPIELVEVVLPLGARVAYDAVPAVHSVVNQQVWLLAGEVDITAGGETHRLGTGDCLAMRVDGPTAFRNAGDCPARYVLALTTEPTPPRRGGTKEGGSPR